MEPDHEPDEHPVKEAIHEIIFEADSFWGKFFDISLLILIVLSILAVMLETVESVAVTHVKLLRNLELVFTGIFTLEYALRIYCVRRPKAYVTSFFGIIDLLAILPTYVAFFIEGSQYFLVLRALRLLRIFRVLKLARYVGESQVLWEAIRRSRAKITVFLFAVFSLALIFGTLMYVIEGPTHGYTSIPKSVYWTIVTITTVGYGDISPETPLGQFFASLSMVLGYGIIAVPTGIVSVELSRAVEENPTTRACPSCMCEGHRHDSVYCRKCGEPLANH